MNATQQDRPPEVRPFQHLSTASRVFGGPGVLGRLSAELDRVKATSPVFFCGTSIATNRALLDHIQAATGGRCVGIFDGVRAHSPIAAVEAGADALRRLQADSVIAVGGGSAVVTARAASILLAENRPLRELCTRRRPDGRLESPKLVAPKIPQFVLATTPTTAMIKAGSAVWDPVSGERLALFDPKTRAHSVFLDTSLLLTAPADLAESASLNAFASAVSGLEADKEDPLADAALSHALRLVAQWLPQLRAAPTDPAARLQLACAAVLCGEGTDHTGGGLVSAIGHSMGPNAHVANGLVNAVMLPYTIRFNAPAARDRHGKIAHALSVPNLGGYDTWTDAALASVNGMFSGLALPRRLRDLGVPRADLPAIAARTALDWTFHNNPRRAAFQDVVAILEEAW